MTSFTSLSPDDLCDILSQIMTASGVFIALNAAFLAFFSERTQKPQAVERSDHVELPNYQVRMMKLGRKATRLSVKAAVVFSISLVLGLATSICAKMRGVDIMTESSSFFSVVAFVWGLWSLLRLIFAFRRILKENT